MRIGVIEVKKLVRVRLTFRPEWRIFIILTFLLVVLFWWGVINQLPRAEQITSNNGLKLQLLILALVLPPILGVSLFKKNGFARLTFALITLFSLPTLLLFALVGAIMLIPMLSQEDGLATVFFVGGVLAIVGILKEYLIGHGYVLFLSVTPFGRAKAFRNQVASSILLWSGHWKSRGENQEVEIREKLRSIAGAPFRLILAVFWFILGAIFVLVSGFGLLNSEFLPAVSNLELAHAWQMVRHFQLTPPLAKTNAAVLFETTGVLLVLALGIGCFFIYGYFWAQRRRENTLVVRGPITQHMTSSDVLLLRTFKDDFKSVGRRPRIWLIPFRVYAWAYTFEQLIVNRLRYIGKVRLLDIDRENEEMLEKRWLTSIVARNRLKRFLISIFPQAWYKLPSKGGIRYYVDTRQDPMAWQPDIIGAMNTARMIVVVLGTTESLTWEMDQIKNLRLLEKTVFLMPPASFKKQYRVRWQRFIMFLNQNGGLDTEPLKKVNPKRVRAVCVHRDLMLIITGKFNGQPFYESAVDIATLFTVADPAHSRSMIHKYLN